MLSFVRRHSHVISGYDSIFFLNRPTLAFAIILITLIHWQIGAAGMLALGFSHLFAKLKSGNSSHRLLLGIHINSLLIGLLFGYLYVVSITWILLCCFQFFFYLFSAWLDGFFAPLNLPTLSLPFSVAAVAIGLIVNNSGLLGDATMYFAPLTSIDGLPTWVTLFFRAISSIFCMPDPCVGALIWLGLIIVSPLTALFALLGFVVSIGTSALFEFPAVVGGVFAEEFNSILIFVGIAGFIMMPSRRSLLTAVIAVFCGVVILKALEAGFALAHLAPMAFPFNLTMIFVISGLRSFRPADLSVSFSDTPESALEQGWLLWNRHRWGEPGVFLPLDSEVQVQQGFQGQLTHRGLWQHALDFVELKADGKPYSGRGLELDDHGIYQRPVLSPLEGTIVSCYDQAADNLIGQVVNTKNWGNYAIIRSVSGFSVTLAHFKKSSLKVKVGELVLRGQPIAECGNSGYSQEPHVHLQGSMVCRSRCDHDPVSPS